MPTAALEKPTLETGDNLTRDEFIRIWDQLPHIKRAELIGGIVYLPAATSIDHGEMDNNIATWIGFYKAMTPGCNSANNASAFMLDDCPQPDVNLRIAPECGGQTWVENRYLHGAAELLVEICNTTESMDLHQKFELYQEAGVKEYVVVVVKKKNILWHRLVRGKFKTMPPDENGNYRSRVFPGLWLDSKALFKDDMAKVLGKLQEGIASDEHQRFVAELAARKR